MRIVVPGGTGLVGTLLSRHFHESGHEVTVLSRRPKEAPVRVLPWRALRWDGVNAGDWTAAVDGADAVINLAGRSVNCRYTARNREEILQSRLQSTRAVGSAIRQSSCPPPLWLNASTATIYRHAFDRPMDEATGELGGGEEGAPSAWDFSIDVAKRWEAAFFELPLSGTRRVAVRSAIVMSADRDGPFGILSRLVRCGLGGKNGSGKQFVSWVHETDFVRAVEFLIERKEIDGVVNIASPNPLPNREFMRDLRDAWNVTLGLPAPVWALELGALFLRTETELILKSRRVVAGRLRESGFDFRYREWREACRDLVASVREQVDA